MDELTPGMELAIHYARQLRAIKPDHELFKYFTAKGDPKLDQEFETRFWNKNFPRSKPPATW
ncbi:MAG TPA: hypothetical protein VHA30_02775 [Patescibacteria group bacterium]|nr:hypothetical protein [Patescibacteria group bacterium]